MLFLTQNHVEERRARGFDESTLYSEPAEDRLLEAKEVSAEIEQAFLGVKLGAGVGLFEGQAIDNYESEAERERKRARDEKEDWRRIDSKHLNACHSSLSFFDPLGMRFHLPAFICCELRGEYRMGLDIRLSELDDLRRSQFSLLSPTQKSAVARFLEFLSEDVDSEFSRPAIERDLIEYWLDGPQPKRLG
ncbi:MAG: hypothetical protein JNJ83_22125 [Verrucomicrobiaceae bacterium]|nr:hypothetical protein [Verrucomicrobiaceae bacterium]